MPSSGIIYWGQTAIVVPRPVSEEEVLTRAAHLLAALNPQSNHRRTQSITNMNIQISFKPDGTAQCLWTEALPLHELGRLEITLASNIEFNNTTQHWEVKNRKGRVRFIASSRSACLEWEQENLQPE